MEFVIFVSAFLLGLAAGLLLRAVSAAGSARAWTPRGAARTALDEQYAAMLDYDAFEAYEREEKR